MLKRPPPPDFCLTDEYRQDVKDEARKKFMKSVIRTAVEFRGLPWTKADAALKKDGGVPGPAMSDLVPEFPWHRAVFVNAPCKRDRLHLSVFFSNDKNGRLELVGTNLWKEFSETDGQGFMIFKAAGISGSRDRIFVMYALEDAMTGEGRCRLVIPQRGRHLVAMQLEDYMACAR